MLGPSRTPVRDSPSIPPLSKSFPQVLSGSETVGGCVEGPVSIGRGHSDRKVGAHAPLDSSEIEIFRRLGLGGTSNGPQRDHFDHLQESPVSSGWNVSRHEWARQSSERDRKQSSGCHLIYQLSGGRGVHAHAVKVADGRCRGVRHKGYKFRTNGSLRARPGRLCGASRRWKLYQGVVR